MIIPSLPSFRASATLAFALTLTGCFSTHPCTHITEDTLAAGHLDYAFNDGTLTSADISFAGPQTTARAASGTVLVAWEAPLSAAAGDMASLLLSMKLPDADGSFNLGTLSAEVCACQSGFVSRSETQAQCVISFAPTTPPPAECQPATGKLEIHHMEPGACVLDSCPDVTVELLLTSPAEKGLSGDFIFLHTRKVNKASCVDFPIDLG